ncbi:RT1 class Ib, locus M3, isoform CRA_b [Rattus norvegicus]|uniref:RT1 class Ib, locus M3, isoform CRA_b n=1 Tax=Rattus norvegicus TaxID=10116 RepID=A6KR50_RAT|nr:RT1 class Ib, locus M3, isoform CRA_b [Rattus norvegicus]
MGQHSPLILWSLTMSYLFCYRHALMLLSPFRKYESTECVGLSLFPITVLPPFSPVPQWNLGLLHALWNFSFL